MNEKNCLVNPSVSIEKMAEYSVIFTKDLTSLLLA